MLEQRISWQHALRYGEIAKRTRFKAEKITPPYHTNATLLPLTHNMAVRDIRDWIYDTVGDQYHLSGVWGTRDEKKVADATSTGKDWFAGGNLTEHHLPCMIRFTFVDLETAILFKLMWFNP